MVEVIFCNQPSTWWLLGAPNSMLIVGVCCWQVRHSAVVIGVHFAEPMNNLHGPLCLVSTGLRQAWLRKEATRCPQRSHLIHLLIQILF